MIFSLSIFCNICGFDRYRKSWTKKMEGDAVVLLGRMEIATYQPATCKGQIKESKTGNYRQCKNAPLEGSEFCRRHGGVEVIRPSGPKLIVDRDFVAKVLDLDSVQRKDMNWTRHSFEEMTEMSQRDVSFGNDLLVTEGNRSGEAHGNFAKNFKAAKQFMRSACICLDDILSFAPGHVILAGGAVSGALRGRTAEDADFFLIDVADPEALIRDLCKVVEDKLRRMFVDDMGVEFGEQVFVPEHPVCLFSRNQNVTTIYVPEEYGADPLPEGHWKHLICYPSNKIQFIHRVYPTPMHVLGGFDIPSAYYDGTNIYTNFLGLVSCSLGVIFVDPSRRSTSYSSRLKKYSRRGRRIVMTNLCGEEVLKKKEEQKYFLTSHGLQIQPCLDVKVRVSNDNKFVAFCDDIAIYHRQGGDYETDDVSGNWMSANALLAWKGKLDQMCWYGTTIEDVFDKPMIKCMIPRFERRFWGGKNAMKKIRRWMQGTKFLAEVDGKTRMKKSELDRIMKPLDEKINLNWSRAMELARKGVTYIRDNPGRQWTSSINPIIDDVRNYYHPMMMNILKIGLSDEIVSVVFWGWKKNLGIFSRIMFVKDVFKMIMYWLRRANAYLLLNELKKVEG